MLIKPRKPLMGPKVPQEADAEDERNGDEPYTFMNELRTDGRAFRMSEVVPKYQPEDAEHVAPLAPAQA